MVEEVVTTMCCVLIGGQYIGSGSSVRSDKRIAISPHVDYS
jgi:hypothetical protein